MLVTVREPLLATKLATDATKPALNICDEILGERGMSESMMLVAAWIVSLGVAVCVGMWIERRRSGALRYGHLAGSDYLYLHGGHLTGKWQRCTTYSILE